MTILSAFVSYLVKLVIFAVVIGLGIFAGIKFRKHKENKEEMKGNEEQ